MVLSRTTLRSIALILFALVLLPSAAFAADPVYSNWRGLSIKGTDPVGYFTQNRPVEGSSAHSLEYLGTTWRFATAENKAAFEAAPKKYLPQYGGYCAWAVSQGYTASVDPEAWSIVDGKLYLNYSKSVMKTWLKDRPGYIIKADKNWPGLRDS